MQELKFKRVAGEGFGSFQAPFTLPLTHNGVNMVIGVNGAGKTTVFSALMWALYGVSLKEVTLAKIATRKTDRNETFRGTRVVVEFTKGETSYMVARHLEFKGTTKGLKGESKLMIFEKPVEEPEFLQDHLQGKDRDKGDMQKHLTGVIGIGSDAFLSSILFGQRMKRLVESEGQEKRKLFEELFELAWVEGAKARATAKAQELDYGLTEIRNKVRIHSVGRVSLAEQLENGQKILNEFETKKAERKETANADIATRVTMVDNLKAEVAKLKVKADKYDPKGDDKLRAAKTAAADKFDANALLVKAANDYLRQAQGEIDKAETSIQRLTQEILAVKTTCPTCLQALPAKSIADVKKKLEGDREKEREVINTSTKLHTKKSGERDALVKTGEKLQLATVAADKVLSDYQLGEQEFKQASTDVTLKTGLLKAAETELAAARQRLVTVCAEEPPTVDLESLRVKDTGLVTEIDRLNIMADERKVELDRVNWWVNKGFSASGLKAFVFNAMLSRLNLYVERYAERLGVRVKFSVDLSKASKPFTTTCYREEVEVEYGELSGGEKQRVDVALAFAMHDLVSHTALVNILVMDEVFEGLDGDGVETVYDLIRLKAGDGKAVYIVSHSGLLDSQYTKHIGIEYDKELRTSKIC